ncbi:MAG: hypothetical protein ABIJ57_08085 [Pseudomonadota bacterium]
MTIRHGGLTYTVEWVDGEVDPLVEDKYCGRVLHMEQRVVISCRTTEERRRESLLHEIIHIVDYAGDLGLSEKKVRRLGRYLFAAFQDNPEAARYIMGAQDEREDAGGLHSDPQGSDR